MPANIRHIVFDIGKVLIHYDPDLPFSWRCTRARPSALTPCLRRQRAVRVS